MIKLSQTRKSQIPVGSKVILLSQSICILWTHVVVLSNSFEQEIDSLKKELESLTAEMKSRAETFRREKAELVRQKDTERKQAVEEVQDQCERDYKQFTADHHDTLTLALKTAREQHSREKVYHTYFGFSRYQFGTAN